MSLALSFLEVLHASLSLGKEQFISAHPIPRIFGLTSSSLSITEWRPVTGSRPPMNQADWDSEFTKYKSSPEFALLNPNMTLDEFKQIYFMEWTHRLWGRVIGMTFLIPTAYFIARRKVTPSMAWKLTGICGLIDFYLFIFSPTLKGFYNKRSILIKLF